MGWNESAWYAIFAGTALKSVAILGMAWLAAWVLRRRSAAARHLVWTTALAALLVLPVLSLGLPALRVPIRFSPAAFFQVSAAPPAHAPAATVAATPDSTAPRAAEFGAGWRRWLLFAWAVGALLSLAQMLAAWFAMWRARRAAPPLHGAEITECVDALGVSVDVDILTTGRGSMPASFGVLRPAVFLPADAAEWSYERRRVVLLHELAHIRRGDPAAQLLARFALSFYWWNPLAWIAWREFLKERERAADDLVLAAGTRASEYAQHLMEIARTMQSAPAMGWAAVAMARRSQLEGRLLAILDPRVTRKGAGRKSALAAAALAAALIAPLAALHAQDDVQSVPADVDATIRAALAQKNHEILDNAASAAAAYRQFDLAQKLLESSLSIRKEVSGEQSADYGQGLIKLGDLERSRANVSEATAFYTKAVSVLGNRPETARALVGLGYLAMGVNDNEKAFTYFQQAQTADPAKAGQALMWMGIVRRRQGDAAGAETLFQQSLAIADPHSPEAANTMHLYASLLQSQGRAEEAQNLVSQADAIRKELDAHATQYRQGAIGTPYRIGAGLTPPTLLYKTEPQYSEEARAAKYQGTVVVGVTVGTDGTAQNMHVVRSLGFGLDEKALQAVSQWKFKPATKDGQPVPVQAQIEVNFRLL